MRTTRDTSGARAGGFTLFEVVIVVGVSLSVMGGVCTIIHQSGRLFGDQVKRWTLDEAGRHLMDRLAEELRSADPTSLKPLAMLNSTYVTYQKVTGFADGVRQLSLPSTIDFQTAPGETPNGMDDNGDGRIDEGFLVLTPSASGPIRLGGNVQSVSFNPVPNGLAFTVTLSVTDQGRLIQKTFYQEVNLRN